MIVSNRGEGTLSIVDAGRLEHINNQDAGGVPDHLISVDDRILVALRDPGVINVLNPATMNVERTLQIDMEPHQMVVVPETDRS